MAAVLPGGPLYGKFKGKNVVVPLCGGNIDTTTLGRVIDRGLAADQRLIRFSATVSDRPGGIATLARDMADMSVSVKVINLSSFFYSKFCWSFNAIMCVD